MHWGHVGFAHDMGKLHPYLQCWPIVVLRFFVGRRVDAGDGILTNTTQLLDNLTQAVGNLTGTNAGGCKQQGWELGEDQLMVMLSKQGIGKGDNQRFMPEAGDSFSVIVNSADTAHPV